MRKALVLGGTHDHIRLIELLKQRGYWVILLDYYENPVAKNKADFYIRESTLDKEKVLSIAKREMIQLVISLCIDQALLTVAYVAEKLGLPCHVSYDSALGLTNKAQMKRRFVELGIPTSRFLVSDESKVDLTGLNFPLVFKPVDANSSKGITKVVDDSGIDSAFRIAQNASMTKNVVIEEYFDGEELSIDVAICNSKPTIIMITKSIKISSNHENFTISQSQYVANVSKTVFNSILQIAENLSSGYNIHNGSLLIQVLHSKDVVKVIEFSARIGGGSKHHFVKVMTGFDILDWLIKVVEGVYEEVKVVEKYRFGCLQYLYAGNGEIQAYHGFEELLENNIIYNYFLYKSTGSIVSNHISSSDRPAGFLIVDNDFENLLKKRTIAMNSIEIRNYQENNIIFRDF
jgi:phosphoribosylamine-glycine ligase